MSVEDVARLLIVSHLFVIVPDWWTDGSSGSSDLNASFIPYNPFA